MDASSPTLKDTRTSRRCIILIRFRFKFFVLFCFVLFCPYLVVATGLKLRSAVVPWLWLFFSSLRLGNFRSSRLSGCACLRALACVRLLALPCVCLLGLSCVCLTASAYCLLVSAGFVYVLASCLVAFTFCASYYPCTDLFMYTIVFTYYRVAGRIFCDNLYCCR